MDSEFKSWPALQLKRLSNLVYNQLFPVPLWLWCFATVSLAATSLGKSSRSVVDLFEIAGALISSGVVCFAVIWLVRYFLRRLVFGHTRWLFETRSNASWHTKLALLIANLVAKRKPKLRSYDSGLTPAQPLPSLQSTLNQFLQSVQPILSDDEYSEFARLGDEFAAGPGRWLQLLLLVKSWFWPNYVVDWWTKYVYLANRASLITGSSVANTDLYKDAFARPASRGANLLHIETNIMLQMAHQDALPSVTNGIPLNADYYQRMFNTCRIPGKQIDTLHHWDYSRHAAIFCNGCWYRVPLCDGNRVFRPAEFEAMLDYVVARAPDPVPGEPWLAALTCTDRTRWAENRQKLLQASPKNKAALETIESSLCVIIFTKDSYEYDFSTEDSQSRMHQRMMTRGTDFFYWCDKNYNGVIASDGRCGGLVEHSWADGFEFDYEVEALVYYDNFLLGYTDDGRVRDKLTTKPPMPSRIEFELNDECQKEIVQAVADTDKLANNVDVASVILRDLGKGVVKRNNISPDAFIQMAIQLTYFELHGEFALTYEAASARFFKNGRTETVRVVSAESCAFVRAAADPSTTPDERMALLRAACNKHNLLNRKAMTGAAPDRHLFALYVAAKAVGVESAFLERALHMPWTLSTSQAPRSTNLVDEDAHPDLSWLGASFAPVAPHGYGLLYRYAGDHSLYVNISSFNSSSANCVQFRDQLKTVLRRMVEWLKE